MTGERFDKLGDCDLGDKTFALPAAEPGRDDREFPGSAILGRLTVVWTLEVNNAALSSLVQGGAGVDEEGQDDAVPRGVGVCGTYGAGWNVFSQSIAVVLTILIFAGAQQRQHSVTFT